MVIGLKYVIDAPVWGSREKYVGRLRLKNCTFWHFPISFFDTTIDISSVNVNRVHLSAAIAINEMNSHFGHLAASFEKKNIEISIPLIVPAFIPCFFPEFWQTMLFSFCRLSEKRSSFLGKLFWNCGDIEWTRKSSGWWMDQIRVQTEQLRIEAQVSRKKVSEVSKE